MINKEEILKELKQITADEDTRDFEQGINRIIDNNDIIQLKENVEEMLENSCCKEEYKLFFLAATIYRRRIDYKSLKNIINKYNERYGDKKSFKFILNMYEKLTKVTEKGEKIIEEAWEISKSCPNNIGCEHSFAESVYMVLESCRSDEVEEIKNKWLDKALASINKATDKNQNEQYGKFHSTKARLLAHYGDFKNAYKEIERAKRIENSNANGYEMKILSYISSESKIQSLEAESKLESFYNQLDKARESIDVKFSTERKRNVEYMGIFIAIISFIIGSVQIAIGQNFATGSMLIVVFTFSVITMFSWFGFIMDMFENRRRSICYLVFVLLGVLVLIFLVKYHG